MHKQISKNIHNIKINLPRSPLRTLNSYVVIGAERNLIIDLGFNRDECYEELSAGIQAIGMDMDRTDIFLTHFHTDHCGLAGRMARENMKIYMGGADALLSDRFFRNKIQTWEETEERFVKAGYTKKELLDTRDKNPAFMDVPNGNFTITEISDGETLDLGGVVLKAVHTPGHTPGHTCLFEEKSGTLFAGDHVLFDITPNITDWQDLDDSLGTYMSSLRRIRQMAVRVALVGHRENVGDADARIDEILAHHGARLDEAKAIVAHNPGLTPYEIASRMEWSIRAASWDDFPLGQKWFAVGEAMAHLKHLERIGLIRGEMEDGQYRYFARA